MAGKTTVSIAGEAFHINGRPAYEGRTWDGKKIAGLLLNARMVNGIFDDANAHTRPRWAYSEVAHYDALRNTREFLAAMLSWREHGLLAFTLNLQGGNPERYSQEQPWHNSAFEGNGSLRADYLLRLSRILERADELGMAVILGLFDFGQDHRLDDEAAVLRAVETAAAWVLSEGYTNVLLEIANECDGAHYSHDILKPPREHELILHAKGISHQGRRLLVSTSYAGGNIPSGPVAREADFLLLHGNGVDDSPEIAGMVRRTRQVAGYTPKPILFNEDDHFDFDQPANNLTAALGEYCSWGYSDPGKMGFQQVPIDWKINTPRKRAFFGQLSRITGAKS